MQTNPHDLSELDYSGWWGEWWEEGIRKDTQQFQMKGVVIVCDGGKDCTSFYIFQNFLNGSSLLCTIFNFERGKFVYCFASFL